MDRELLIFSGMGLELLSIVAGGFYFGSKLKETYGFSENWILGILILAIIGWFIHLFLLLKRYAKKRGL